MIAPPICGAARVITGPATRRGRFAPWNERAGVHGRRRSYRRAGFGRRRPPAITNPTLATVHGGDDSGSCAAVP